ncbi:transposase family protein [Pontibacter sp. CAU 1760]
MHKSVFHYTSKKEDTAVKDALQETVSRFPMDGFWGIYKRLRIEGHPWNHKKVYRVYKALGLEITGKAKGRGVLRRQDLGMLPLRLNDTWTVDFGRGYVRGQPHFRSFHIMDACSREALHMEVCFQLSSESVTGILESLMKDRGKPHLIEITLDQEIKVPHVKAWGVNNQVKVLLTQGGEETQASFIENLHAPYKRDILDHMYALSIKEAHDITQQWLKAYNLTPQKTLGGISPENRRQELEDMC